MEHQDTLERRIQSLFSEYEVAPPESVWRTMHSELHSPATLSSSWERFGSGPFQSRNFRVYSLVTLVMVILVFGMVYFVSADHHTISGCAFTGDDRLNGGTAILFRVNDAAKPWDSVCHYRSAFLDKNGHFHFSGLEGGTYLLRVEPESLSDQGKRFLPSWYDMHDDPSTTHPIIISDQDIKADVHLIPRVESRDF